MENAGTRQNERDFYKEIASRAKRMRERAAESLRRSRETRRLKKSGDAADAARRRPTTE